MIDTLLNNLVKETGLQLFLDFLLEANVPQLNTSSQSFTALRRDERSNTPSVPMKVCLTSARPPHPILTQQPIEQGRRNQQRERRSPPSHGTTKTRWVPSLPTSTYSISLQTTRKLTKLQYIVLL